MGEKKVKLKVRATKKGDIEISFGGNLDLDRLVDKAAAGIGEALSSLTEEAPKPTVAMRSRGKKVVAVAVDQSRVPDLTEDEAAKREPPQTRVPPSQQGPRICPICRVRMRDCAGHPDRGVGR